MNLENFINNKIFLSSNVFNKNQLISIESISSENIKEIYFSIEKDSIEIFNIIKIFLNNNVLSSESVFSKERMKSLYHKFIEFIKKVFTKIIMVIINFTKRVSNYIKEFALKKQTHLYNQRKLNIIEFYNRNKMISLNTLQPPKSNIVFSNPDVIINNVVLFWSIIEKLTKDAKSLNVELHKYFANNKITNFSKLFLTLKKAPSIFKIYFKDLKNFFNYLSLNDKDVMKYINNMISKSTPENDLHVLRFSSTIIAKLYIYGESSITNYTDVLNFKTPQWKKPDKYTLEKYLSVLGLNEFEILSDKNAKQVKSIIYRLEALSKEIISFALKNKMILDDLEVLVNKLFDEKSKIRNKFSENFDEFNEIIKSIMNIINFNKTLHEVILSFILTYYSCYLKHRNYLYNFLKTETY